MLENAEELNALVFDVRINFGGADPYGLAIASRLTANRYLAYTERNQERHSRPNQLEPGPGELGRAS